MRRATFLLVTASLALGCGKSSESTPATTSGTSATKACVVGVWIHGERACTCMTDSPLNTPQCSATDCKESGVMVLRDDGKSVDVTIQRSALQQKFSVVGSSAAAQSGAWSLDADGRKLTQTNEARTWTTDVTCAGDTLTRPKLGSYQRAQKGFADAVVVSSTSGAWTDQSYAP